MEQRPGYSKELTNGSSLADYAVRDYQQVARRSVLTRRFRGTGGARDFLNIFSSFCSTSIRLYLLFVHTQRTGVRIGDAASFSGVGGTGAGIGGGDTHAPMDEVQRHLHGRKKSRRGWEDQGRKG